MGDCEGVGMSTGKLVVFLCSARTFGLTSQPGLALGVRGLSRVGRNMVEVGLHKSTYESAMVCMVGVDAVRSTRWLGVERVGYTTCGEKGFVHVS